MKSTLNVSGPTRLVVLLAVSTATLVAAAAKAEARVNTDEPRSITVSVGDIDLTSSKGQEVFKRRIKRAADLVCGSPDSRELRLLSSYKSCVNEATNSAFAQVRNPQR